MNKQNLKSATNHEMVMKQITTNHTWNDLVVSEPLMNSLKAMQYHLVHGEHLKNEWGFGTTSHRGYVALFTGAPGTGKTMAASLLGTSIGREVYKVDLSTVVSTYIGETEKNIKKLFEKAESNDWILYFDEADALFGKRTEVKDAHDKYANIEVGYLLQRIEAYNGLIILASNRKSNIDSGFMRRIRYVMHFPRPNRTQRHSLWQNAIAKGFKYDKAVDLEQLAKTHALTGGSIVKVLNASSLTASDRKDKVITNADIKLGLRLVNKTSK